MGIRMRSLCRAKNSECVHVKQSELLTCWRIRGIGIERRSWADSCCFVCHTEGCSKWTREKITLTSECQSEMGDENRQPLWVLVNALRIYMIHIHLQIHIRLGNPAQPRAIQRHCCWAWIMGLSREVVVSICCSMGILCPSITDSVWMRVLGQG